MLRVIGHADRILSEGVPADPDEVRDFCIDLSNVPAVWHGGSISAVSRRAVAGGDADSYLVRDGLGLGFLTVPVFYTVRLRVPVAGAVSAEANPVPWVRLESVVAFEPLDSGTRLLEYLRISAPRPLLSLVVGRTVATHTELMAGVRRHFEGRA